VASACGKLILLGEHAVVYGEPAIAVPLRGLRLSVVLAEARGERGERRPQVPESEPDFDPDTQDAKDTLALPAVRPTLDGAGAAPLRIDLEPDAPPEADAGVARALGAVAQSLGLPVPLPLRLAVRSGGLVSGMGTSAALAVALSRGLLRWHGQADDEARILAAALSSERLFHGQPSGIDHSVSALEQPLWFEKGRPPLPLRDLPRILLAVRPRRSAMPTSLLVERVRERIVAEASLVRDVAEMGRWTREGRQAWAEADLPGLGEAMRRQQEALGRLGVVLDEDREGIAAALSAGALAAKITGAGGGGTLLALVEESSAEAVIEAWGGAASGRIVQAGGEAPD
jgi:mevalonate kinase